jgi:hypothetical protein
VLPNSSISRPGGADQRGLDDLAKDSKLIGAAVVPRFPPTLLNTEDKLHACLAGGDRRQIDQARDEFVGRLHALLISDGQRLSGLPDGRAHDRERDFLKSRLLVLDTRLAALDAAPALEAAPAPVADEDAVRSVAPPLSTLGISGVPVGKARPSGANGSKPSIA